jgi:hypothetical protein
MADQACEWCGHEHPRAALCSKRLTWSRRGFLALLGAAAIGVAVDPLRVLSGTESIVGLEGAQIRQFILVSEKLLQDASIDLEAYVRAALVRTIEGEMAKFEERLLYGTNSLAAPPLGFLKAS